MATVTFKLPDDLMAKLEQKAEQCNCTSPHKCAQQIVINYLEDTERDRARKQMAELQRQVLCLREDLATAVVALLLRAGKATDADEVQQWVERNLMSS
jgi:predicted transcriptional regulator